LSIGEDSPAEYYPPIAEDRFEHESEEMAGLRFPEQPGRGALT
jgi:hypothetical protein